MNLTVDTSIGITKIAFDVRLKTEPGDWAPEIISAAYKSLPFLKSYEMDAELERVDESRGYGVGKLMVYPMGMEKDAAIKQGSMVVFPIIVREKNLAPFDVFSHEGEFRPMTKEAVERVLFQPGVFGQPIRKDDMQGLGGSTSMGPPTSSTQRWSGGLSKTSSVLDAIAPTIREADRHDFIVKIGSHPGLKMVYEGTPALRSAVLAVGQGKEKTAGDIREQRRSSTPPDVIQITESGVGYMVKHASSRCFRPITEHRTAHEVRDLIGEEGMESLRDQGSVVLTTRPTAGPSEMLKTAQQAETVGVYMALKGTHEVPGIFIPKMVTLDGEMMAEGAFASLDSHALQKVAGVHVRDITIPHCQPRGLGVFVYQSGVGGIATEPVDIEHEVTIEKVAYLLGTRANTGAPVRLMVSPGLTKIAKIGEGEYAIPREMVFLPLKGKQIHVEEDPQVVNRLYAEKTAMDASTVEVVSDGLSFSLRGQNADFSGFGGVLNREEVAFALGSLGVDGRVIPTVIEKAASARAVKVPGTRRVLKEELVKAAMVKRASEVLPSCDHLRRDLTREVALMCLPRARALYKTASVLVEKENLDAVLSLNFITPENVSTFVDSISDFEKTANKLAEIVVASRMGMDEVREAAASRAMKGLSDVIGGLAEIRDKIQ